MLSLYRKEYFRQALAYYEYIRRMNSSPQSATMRQHELIPVILTANKRIRPRLHRLTFYAEAFRTYTLSGPDEFFGLVMPQAGQEFRPFPVDGINLRSAVSAICEERRPDLRWYTIRALHSEEATVDVDVVTHGDSGPGSRWIRRARAGDTAGFFTCNDLWRPTESAQLLVADASALPALRHILAYQENHNPAMLRATDVMAVVTSEDEVEPGLATRWETSVRSLRIIHTQPRQEADAVVAALRADYARASGPGYVWASGEGELAKSVRGLAVNEWGLDTTNVTWVPYWFYGRARP